MPLQPSIFLGLVRVQVIQNNMDLSIRVGRYDLIHEIQKLPPAPPVVVTGNDLPGGDVESGKQGRSTVALIAVTGSIQRLAIGQSQPALRPFQSLDGWFFIHTQYQRVLRRVQIQPYNVGCFRTEFRIGADTPTPSSLQANVMLPQDSPDVIIAHVTQGLSYQRTR